MSAGRMLSRRHRLSLRAWASLPTETRHVHLRQWVVVHFCRRFFMRSIGGQETRLRFLYATITISLAPSRSALPSA